MFIIYYNPSILQSKSLIRPRTVKFHELHGAKQPGWLQSIPLVIIARGREREAPGRARFSVFEPLRPAFQDLELAAPAHESIFPFRKSAANANHAATAGQQRYGMSFFFVAGSCYIHVCGKISRIGVHEWADWGSEIVRNGVAKLAGKFKVWLLPGSRQSSRPWSGSARRNREWRSSWLDSCHLRELHLRER
jgi:hypothetical protein